MAQKAQFKLPAMGQRLSLFGATGTGKTQCGAWILSQAPYDKYPFTIFDFKGDDLLNGIDRIEEITLKNPPKKSGLYIVKPRPDEQEDIENFLWKIWEREKQGIFIDEGYMIAKNSSALSAILTQGRSKKIQATILSQRPKWLNPFVISEASMYGTFRLQDRNDVKRVQEFYPLHVDLTQRLPEFNCRWYDIGQDALFQLKPAPDRASILQYFDDRLTPKRKFF